MQIKVKSAMLLTLIVVLALALVAGPVMGQAGAVDRPLTDVEIVRDKYGVPHIYADNLEGLFYGFGYVVAEDRLFQLEMIRRSVWGTVSEVLGEDFINFDKQIRTGGYTRAEIEERIAAVDEEYQIMLKSYAEGINGRIEEVMQKPELLLPAEFTQLGFEPPLWAAADVANIFVGTMATRYSDFAFEHFQGGTLASLMDEFGEEMGKEMFSDTHWLDDPGAPTTVPRSEDWLNSDTAEANLSGVLPEDIIASSREFENMQADYEDALYRLGLPDSAGSNAFIVGGEKTATGEAILFGGPQMGWFQPGYLHEVGLHGAGFNVVGTTTTGYPAILFGHNEDIAFTSTAGLGNVVDIFAEELHPEDPTRYLFNGAWLEMEKREEVIKVKGEEDIHAAFFRTVHGPVIQINEAANVAYSKGRSWENLELESMAGWIDSTRATNWDEFLEASQRMAITISYYYADRLGNIGYAFTGKYPIRHPEQDPRLPTPGTGEREWIGFLSPEEVPHIYNPDAGFIVNWNQQPAAGWNNPSFMFWGKADRSNVMYDWMEGRSDLTAEDVAELNKHASFADVNEKYFRERLINAVQQLADGDKTLLQAAALLEEWDGLRQDSNGDGYYDSAGQVIFEYWLTQMLKDTFTDWFGTSLNYSYPRTVFGGSLNVPKGAKVLLQVLDGEDASVPMSQDYLKGLSPEQSMLDSLQNALETLTAEKGTEMDSWRVPITIQRFSTINFAGVPQSYREPIDILYLNRGSENHIVALDPDKVTGTKVNPPGQSGFIRPDGSAAPHSFDQLALYKEFLYKPMHFYADDVVKNTKTSMVLNYEPFNGIKLTIGMDQALVQDRIYTLDAVPFIDYEANRTLVPLRFISEALGFEVEWLADSQQIKIVGPEAEILLTIGSEQALVNGNEVAMDCLPQLLPPNRTFVPLRFIAESLGATVDWSARASRITILSE